MPSERDWGRLETIAKLIDDITRRLSGLTLARFAEDGDEQDLTAFRLSAIGEIANKLSERLKARHPDIPWREMYAFRNLISHEYAQIVPRFVWAAAHELDGIKAMCTEELARPDD